MYSAWIASFYRHCSQPVQWLTCKGNVAPAVKWIAIVQNADSLSLFDDLDSALRSGSAKKRVPMLRQLTHSFPTEAEHPELTVPVS
jgi:hypothetical protein